MTKDQNKYVSKTTQVTEEKVSLSCPTMALIPDTELSVQTFPPKFQTLFVNTVKWIDPAWKYWRIFGLGIT